MSVEPTATSGRLYTVGEVERATGLPAATIRAWERRYGVPRPERSAGRHRLYSERDLSLLRWLIARLGEGMTIGRAAALWRHQATRGTDVAWQIGPDRRNGPVGRGLDDLRADWTSACLHFDRRLAQSITSEAFSLYSVLDTSVELLLRGLSELGTAWSRGEATVQQEHFASAVASHQVERLLAAASPWRNERVLLACPPGEQHAFPMLFLALLLMRRGIEAVFLGANVPMESLDSTVREVHPDLAILSTQMESGVAALAEMARDLEGLGVPVGYGGLPFNLSPDLRELVTGRFLGETIPAAPDVVESLLASLSQTTPRLEEKEMAETVLRAGDPAPDFDLPSDGGSSVRLSDFRGRRVVVYFYPKDDTTGCTAQACGFRDNYVDIEEKNAVVLGISPDSIPSHQKFKTKYNLPFILLADQDHSVAERYGVWQEKSLYGKRYFGIVRSHFVVDENGRIADAQVKVSPQESVERALAALS